MTENGTPREVDRDEKALARVEQQTMRQYGRVAGLLFIAAAASAVPSSLVLMPRPALPVYLLVLAAVGCGLACLAIPWERLPRTSLHAPIVVATVLLALWCRYAALSYEVYYLFVALYAAYVFPSWDELQGHLLIVTAALLVPVLGRPGEVREVAREALLILPSIVIVAVAIAYLRRRLDERERVYREFAEEAYAIADKISMRAQLSRVGAAARRGAATAPAAEHQGELATLLSEGRLLGLRTPPEAARASRRRPLELAAAVVVAIPVLILTLATAGVSMPHFARSPLRAVGVSLPNQTTATLPERVPLPHKPASAVAQAPRHISRPTARRPRPSSSARRDVSSKGAGPSASGKGGGSVSARSGGGSTPSGSQPPRPVAAKAPSGSSRTSTSPAGTGTSTGGGSAESAGATPPGGSQGPISKTIDGAQQAAHDLLPPVPAPSPPPSG